MQAVAEPWHLVWSLGFFRWIHLDVPALLQAVMGLLALTGFLLHWRVSADRIPIALVCILVVGATMFVYQAPPPRRAFLFLVPIYLGLVAAGFALVSRIFSVWKPSSNVFSVVVLIVTVAGAISVLQEGTPRDMVASGGMSHPDEVFEILEGRLRPGDDVRGVRRLWWPTRYYLRKKSLIDHLAWAEPDGKRVFLLIQHEHVDVNERIRTLKDYGKPRLIGVAGNTAVYRLEALEIGIHEDTIDRYAGS